jgi:hypothetical protein
MSIGIAAGTGCGCEDIDQVDQKLVKADTNSTTLQQISAALESIIENINSNVDVDSSDEQIYMAVSDIPVVGNESYTVGIESIVEKAKAIIKAIIQAAVDLMKNVLSYIFGYGKLGGNLYDKIVPEFMDTFMRKGNYNWRDNMSALNATGHDSTSAELVELEKLILHGPIGFTLENGNDFWHKVSGAVEASGRKYGSHWPIATATLNKLADTKVVGADAALSDDELQKALTPESVYGHLNSISNDIYDDFNSLGRTNESASNMSQASKQMKELFSLIKRYRSSTGSKLNVAALPRMVVPLKRMQEDLGSIFEHAAAQKTILEKAFNDLDTIQSRVSVDQIDEKCIKQIRMIVSDAQAYASCIGSWFSLCLAAGSQMLKLDSVLVNIKD